MMTAMNGTPSPATRRRSLLGLVGWLALVAAAAAIGARASVDAPTFYAELARPAWAPPAWLFAPVWTVLYAAMAVAAWLVWRERGLAAARVALLLFAAQLAANALWSWLFFAWREGALALAEIVLLAALIAATMAAFARRSKIAAALLAPYLIWVAFATALTFALWRGNPGLLA